MKKKEQPKTIDIINKYADLDPDIEFMLAVRAKTGDLIAFKKLWVIYCSLMIEIFINRNDLSLHEKMCEAVLLFIRKIELFNPDEIRINPVDWEL